jgi:diaminohydroxyphosphoribosylaminopyrimidine deaminase/5-amino-6-(5-phosphoribosylamino)uracil reductase
MKKDKKYMNRCFELAIKGIGNVAPNPMVGAVIVHNGEIIGEGYHEEYGEAHAEVNAIKSVNDKTVLSEATIYVSLEPCAHFGKTPPCADLLVKHNFKKVVISCGDTFSEVAGKGIERLKNAGIEVEVGILEKEGRELNKRFFTFHEKKRPYVVLKWAQTSDGFIDKLRIENQPEINWITGSETKKRVHKWRSQEVAIVVGKNTVLNDNPSLTVREVDGKNPIRIVIDPQASLDTSYSVFNDDAPTIIFNLIKNLSSGTNNHIQLPDLKCKTILTALYNLSIQSLIIEGGAVTLQNFIDFNLWDEARIFTGPIDFHSGLKAPTLKGNLISTEIIGKDTLTVIKNQ